MIRVKKTFQLTLRYIRKYTIITKKELELKLQNKENFYLIDVRTQKETDICSIETSKKIPLAELEDSLKLEDKKFLEKYKFQKPKENDEIVFYCRSGQRSTTAFEISKKLGYKK